MRWSCCRAWKQSSRSTSWAGRKRGLGAALSRTPLSSRQRAAACSRGRTTWRWNILGIFGFDLLFQFCLVLNTSPAAFNLRLCNPGLHGRRFNRRRRLRDFKRRRHHQFVTLHLRERSRFGSDGQIGSSLALNCEPLNRPARVRANDVVVRAIIIDHVVLNSDVGDVHRVTDVGNVLCWRKDSIAQHRFTDKTHVTKVVILRSDIVFDIDPSADRLSLINNSRPAWRQRCPADVVAPGSP